MSPMAVSRTSSRGRSSSGSCRCWSTAGSPTCGLGRGICGGSGAPARLGTDARVVVLVPSYKEDAHVVRQTLLSAVLQDHPNKEVVLLIDDPPLPSTREDAATLHAARALPDELRELLAAPAATAAAACADFARRRPALAAAEADSRAAAGA